jgi:general secretion pathway protein J
MTNDSAHLTGRRASGEAGFTLIELLATLTILGFIMAGITGGLRILTSGWEKNAARVNQVDMVARAVDLIRRDVEGAQRFSTIFEGAPLYLFKGEAEELSFVVVEPPYPTQPGLYFIDYALQPSPEGVALVRARAPFENGMRAFPGATPANIVPLIEGQLAFHFSYAHKVQAGWEWQDSWPFPTRLPDLIRLEVVKQKTGEPFMPPLLLAIKADAELYCISERPRFCSPKSDGELTRIESGPKRIARDD